MIACDNFVLFVLLMPDYQFSFCSANMFQKILEKKLTIRFFRPSLLSNHSVLRDQMSSSKVTNKWTYTPAPRYNMGVGSHVTDRVSKTNHVKTNLAKNDICDFVNVYL